MLDKRCFFEDKLLDTIRENFNWCVISCITLLAIQIRVVGFNFESGDYKIFIHPWLQYLCEHGGISAIATINTDYTPPSLLMYALISYLPQSAKLRSVKILACLFDFILAYFSGLIIKELTGNITKSKAAYCAVLFCPTVFLNTLPTWEE